MQRRDGKRFSLLLLEDGDHYVNDWVATCHLLDGQPAQLEGRLRLCARSLFFEPREMHIAVFMFPLRRGTVVRHDEGRGRLLLGTDSFVKMRENGEDAPYDFVKREDGLSEWAFSLDYARVDHLLSELLPLLAVLALPYEQRDPEVQRMADAMESAASFDVSRLVDLSESILLSCLAAQVTPLVPEPGRLVVTQLHLYFQPLHSVGNDSPVRCFPLSALVTAARRRHSLRERGLEVFFSQGPLGGAASLGGGCTGGGLGDPFSCFFTFRSQSERDQAATLLLSLAGGEGSKAAVARGLLEADAASLSRVVNAWKEGHVSNFEYVLYLNVTAGRSFNDLTQWPVMPWLLADYTSAFLDLTNPATFRDLSKPIGALNPSRLADFRSRYMHMLRDEELTGQKAFLYGTHYSAPGYILYWLVRVAPAHMLRLQNGRFDAADRLFNGLRESWESVLTNASDVKELIPEFFMPPSDFLTLPDGLHLGVRQNGTAVGDVELSPWASDADDFIAQHAEAMESEWVSQHLHHWIDLIFGYKQTGSAAVEANNVFHSLTYEGAVDLDKVENFVQRRGYEAQINEFGQTPRQLFTSPHPQRNPGTAQASRHIGFNRADAAARALLHRNLPSRAATKGSGNPLAASPLEGTSVMNRLLSHLMAFAAVPPPPAAAAAAPAGQVNPVAKKAEPAGASPLVSATPPGTRSASSSSSSPSRPRRQPAAAAGSASASRLESGSTRAYSSSSSNDVRKALVLANSTVRQQHQQRIRDWMSTFAQLSQTAGVEGSMDATRHSAGGKASTHSATGPEGEGNNARAALRGPSVVRRMSVQQHREGIAAVALSPSNTMVASIEACFRTSTAVDCDLWSWDDATAEGRKELQVEARKQSTSDVLLYSAGRDSFVKVYCVPSGVQIRSVRVCPEPILCMALAPLQLSELVYPVVLVGSYDDCVWAYSLDFCHPLGMFRAHDDTPTCMRMGSSGGPLAGSLFTASRDGVVRQWSIEEARLEMAADNAFASPSQPSAAGTEALSELHEHDTSVTSLALGPASTPAHSLVLSGADNGVAVAWDTRCAAGSGVVWSRTVAAGAVAGMQMSGDGRCVVLAGGDGVVRCLEMRTGGTELGHKHCSSEALLCCEVAGATAIAGGNDGALNFWSWDQDQQQQQGLKAEASEDESNSAFFRLRDHKGALACMAVASEAYVIATGSSNSNVHAYYS